MTGRCHCFFVASISRWEFRAPAARVTEVPFATNELRATPLGYGRTLSQIVGQTPTQKKVVSSKALAEAKTQNRLSAFGTPYPDGG
jgi:hypothetical protein